MIVQVGGSAGTLWVLPARGGACGAMSVWGGWGERGGGGELVWFFKNKFKNVAKEEKVLFFCGETGREWEMGRRRSDEKGGESCGWWCGAWESWCGGGGGVVLP